MKHLQYNFSDLTKVNDMSKFKKRCFDSDGIKLLITLVMFDIHCIIVQPYSGNHVRRQCQIILPQLTEHLDH